MEQIYHRFQVLPEEFLEFVYNNNVYYTSNVLDSNFLINPYAGRVWRIRYIYNKELYSIYVTDYIGYLTFDNADGKMIVRKLHNMNIFDLIEFVNGVELVNVEELV